MSRACNVCSNIRFVKCHEMRDCFLVTSHESSGADGFSSLTVPANRIWKSKDFGPKQPMPWAILAEGGPYLLFQIVWFQVCIGRENMLSFIPNNDDVIGLLDSVLSPVHLRAYAMLYPVARWKNFSTWRTHCAVCQTEIQRVMRNFAGIHPVL